VESIALSSTVFGKLVIDVDGMISKWFFKIQRIMKNSHAIGLAAVAQRKIGFPLLRPQLKIRALQSKRKADRK